MQERGTGKAGRWEPWGGQDPGRPTPAFPDLLCVLFCITLTTFSTQLMASISLLVCLPLRTPSSLRRESLLSSDHCRIPRAWNSDSNLGRPCGLVGARAGRRAGSAHHKEPQRFARLHPGHVPHTSPMCAVRGRRYSSGLQTRMLRISNPEPLPGRITASRGSSQLRGSPQPVCTAPEKEEPSAPAGREGRRKGAAARVFLIPVRTTFPPASVRVPNDGQRGTQPLPAQLPPLALGPIVMGKHTSGDAVIERGCLGPTFSLNAQYWSFDSWIFHFSATLVTTAPKTISGQEQPH